MSGRDIFLLTLLTLCALSLLPLAWDLLSSALAYWPRRFRGPLITVECNCGKRFIFRFTRTGQEAPSNDLTQRHLEIHRAGCWDVP